MPVTKNISANSIFSTTPYVYSKYGRDTSGLVVNSQNVCRLYVDLWGNDKSDKLPNGFIPDNDDIKALISPASSSIITATNPYIRFLVQGIQSSFQESIMIQNNFTHGFSTYVFGQDPPQVAISGLLLHTHFDKWDEIVLSMYTHFLRASKLAEVSLYNKKDYRVVFRYQNKIMKGSLINFSSVANATIEQAVSFNMTLLLKELSFAWKGEYEDVGVVPKTTFGPTLQTVDGESLVSTLVSKQSGAANTKRDTVSLTR
jgi:hypothetical protein